MRVDLPELPDLPGLVDAGLAAASLVLFVVAYRAALLLTRPARIPAGPAVPELGEEPPALVSLLANRWQLTEDASESTLLDLAARRLLELRQVAGDPQQTTIHLAGRPAPPDLTAYEQRVLDRVRGLAVDGMLPVTALTFRNEKEAHHWSRRLHDEVRADARRRGLSRPRFSALTRSLLTVVAAVSAVGLGLAVYRYGVRVPDTDAEAAPWVSLTAFVVMFGFAGKSPGDRETPAGRELAARWLGVRAWLRAHEEFANLPPAAVMVWDRYLPYGAALGVTRVASAVLDLGMGSRKLVWSSYGDRWRRVKVRYPRFWKRYGKTAPVLVFRALVTGGAGFALAYFSAWPAEQDLPPFADSEAATQAVLVIGLLLLLRGGYRLLRAVADLATTRTITGQVLWLETWRSQARKHGPPVPVLHYLAIDDGGDDRTTAWILPSQWAGRCRDGDEVTVRVRPWSRRVASLARVEQGRAAELAAQTDPLAAGTALPGRPDPLPPLLEYLQQVAARRLAQRPGGDGDGYTSSTQTIQPTDEPAWPPQPSK